MICAAMYITDPKLREEFNAREKALKDKTSALETAEARGVEKGVAIGKAEGIELGREEGVAIGEAKGKAEGIELGREEGAVIGAHKAKLQTAQNLLDILDDETIAMKVGLQVEEVKALRGKP